MGGVVPCTPNSLVYITIQSVNFSHANVASLTNIQSCRQPRRKKGCKKYLAAKVAGVSVSSDVLLTFSDRLKVGPAGDAVPRLDTCRRHQVLVEVLHQVTGFFSQRRESLAKWVTFESGWLFFTSSVSKSGTLYHHLR